MTGAKDGSRSAGRRLIARLAEWLDPREAILEACLETAALRDFRLVSTPMFGNGRSCGKIVVPADAPGFARVEKASERLDGQPFAVHRGACANRAQSGPIHGS